MAELVLFLLQTLFDVVWSILFELPFEWLPRRSERIDIEDAAEDAPASRLGWMLWLLIGAMIGLASWWLWPHSFATRPAQRIAALILAPPASAALGYALALLRSRRSSTIMPVARAWQAFWFTLGFVGVRYIASIG